MECLRDQGKVCDCVLSQSTIVRIGALQMALSMPPADFKEWMAFYCGPVSSVPIQPQDPGLTVNKT